MLKVAVKVGGAVMGIMRVMAKAVSDDGNGGGNGSDGGGQ